MLATIEERTLICAYYCKKHPLRLSYVFRGELVLVVKLSSDNKYFAFFGSPTTFKIFGIRKLYMEDGKVSRHRILRDEEVKHMYKGLKTFKLI